MAFNISYKFQVNDGFSRNLNKFQKLAGKIPAKMAKISASAGRSMKGFADKTVLAMRRAGKAVRDFANKAGTKLRSVGKSLTTKLTLPLSLLGGFALRASAQTETLTVAFESLLGNADKAKQMVKDIREFAAKTPFQFGDIGGATKQLLSFGVSSEEVFGKLKFLGDIAAGAGVPLANMALIFGKVKAKGKAMTEEILQASERGIPIIAVLAKSMKVPEKRIFDLASKGKITAKIFENALKSMTDKGGIFFDQMAKQSNTLKGIFSTLVDNIDNILSDVGDELAKTFDLKKNMIKFIKFLKDIGEKFKAFTKENPRLVKIIFIFLAIAAVLGPLLIMFGLMASGLAIIGGVIGGLTVSIGAVAAGIAILLAGWLFFSGKTKKVDVFKSLFKAGKALMNFFSGLGDFFVNLWLAPMLTLEKLGSSIIETFKTIFSFLGKKFDETVDAFSLAGQLTDLDEFFERTLKSFSSIKLGFKEVPKFPDISLAKGLIKTPSVPDLSFGNSTLKTPSLFNTGLLNPELSREQNINFNGQIDVTASGGAQVTSTESRVSGATGNFGFNLAGASGSF